MWNILLANLPNIIGVALIFGLLGAIFYNGYKNRKSGKHSCSCGCGGCAGCNLCRPAQKKEDGST